MFIHLLNQGVDRDLGAFQLEDAMNLRPSPVVEPLPCSKLSFEGGGGFTLFDVFERGSHSVV
jgi:hypothetical protein